MGMVWDVMAFWIFGQCADAGDTPAPPKAGRIAPPLGAYWRQFLKCNCGEEKGRGVRDTRAGARRDSLALRCPARIPARRTR